MSGLCAVQIDRIPAVDWTATAGNNSNVAAVNPDRPSTRETVKHKGRKYADPIGVAQYDPFVAAARVEAVGELFARVVSAEDSEPKKQPAPVREKALRRSRRRK
jgi:hypothetical protein